MGNGDWKVNGGGARARNVNVMVLGWMFACYISLAL